MPGDLNGLQVAEKILADKPGMKAIITSGYKTDNVALSKLSEASMVYLAKPFDPETLTAVIENCLQGTQGRFG